MEKLNFAILGAGAIAKSMAKAVNGIREELTPYAVASQSSVKAAEALCREYGFQTAYDSYEKLLADPQVDLVYVATVTGLHYEHAKRCLEHGKHVLCEKSFTLNAREAEELIALAQSRGLFLGEAMWTRFEPWVEPARRLVAEGAIGEVLGVEAAFCMSEPADKGSRLLDPAIGGGALLDLGVYPLTFASLFLGKDIQDIKTTGKLENGVDVDDYIELHFAGGARAELWAGLKGARPPHAEVKGSRGRLLVEGFWFAQSFTVENEAGSRKYDYPFEVNGYEYEVRSALKAIAAGKRYSDEMPWDETLRIMRLMDSLRAKWGLVYPHEKGTKKLNVGILFGGKSAEHEVSLQSAKNVYDAINRDAYNPILIGIDKSGRWILNDAERFLLNADDPVRIRLNDAGEPVALVPESGGALSRLASSTGPAGEAGGSLAGLSLDLVFPILHGPFGEDGTVQGLLKLADVPFVGSGVLGSAVGMDKDVMKRLLREGGIPIGKFIALWSHEPVPPFAEAARTLGCPMFVKPANMGSSVGVAKIHNEAEYTARIPAAFEYDRKIILEEFIEGREIECAVLGNGGGLAGEPIASIPGEVIPRREFYSYEAKYTDENGAALEIPAKLDAATVKRVQDLALKTFKILNCEGLGRVDCFLKKDGAVLINEINTMPGFTRISMYSKLWEASGIPYPELIDRLIGLAFQRYEAERRLKTSYAG